MPTRISDVSELSDAALLCRRSAVRHQWQEAGFYDIATDARGNARFYTEVLRCARCTLEKHLQLDRHHHWRPTKRPRYVYPDGFLAAKGVQIDTDAVSDEYYGRRVTSRPTHGDIPHNQ